MKHSQRRAVPETKKNPVTRFLLGVALCCFGAIFFGVGSTGTAAAGEYEVWSCKGPAGQPLPTTAWRARSFETVSGGFVVTDDCASGGGYSIELTDLNTGSRRPRLSLNFDIPRGYTLNGYQMRRSLETSPPDGPAYDYQAGIREALGGPFIETGCASNPAPPEFPCQDLGNPGDPDDPANFLDRPALSLSGLESFVSCSNASGCGTPTGSFGARFTLFQSMVRVRDDDPPGITGIGGPLTENQPIISRASLYVRATDSNGGVDTMSLEIDGAQVETQTSSDYPSCARPFVIARPCPELDGRIFVVDPATLTHGEHTARVRVTDAAGNTVESDPIPFAVADGGSYLVDNGSPAVRQPVIALDSTTLWHKPGKSASLNGSLRTESGAPVSGARLGVQLTQFGTSSITTRDLPQVITGPDGRFAIPVTGDGSKTVRVSFAPSNGLPETASAQAEVKTRLAIKFKAKPRKVRIGKTVKFTGVLKGAGAAARNVPVEIQALSGKQWRTVQAVKTRKGGKFVWKYRFRFVKRDAIFTFRAVVRSGTGWPWPTLNSRKVKVRVNV